jgi:hypothetical protein
MSFNKENFFVEGNSEEFFFSRTNPLANAANAEILKIEDCGGCCDIQLDLDMSTTAGTTTIEFNTPTDDYDTKYVKVQITDGQGNFVTAVGTGVVDELTLDVTGLNGSDWSVIIEISIGELDILGCDCVKKFSFAYNGGDLSIDTEAIGIGILRGSATEGGTYNLTTIPAGAFPDGGTDEDFDFYVRNIGANALRVESISITGDVLSAAFDTTFIGSGTLFPSDIRKIATTLDSSGAVGSYSGTVVFNYTDGTTQVITITYTLA